MQDENSVKKAKARFDWDLPDSTPEIGSTIYCLRQVEKDGVERGKELEILFLYFIILHLYSYIF